MVHFNPERSDTIRANLINHIAENAPPRRRRALWAAGFVLAGALVGAGALAGALAVSGMFTAGDVQLRVPNYGPAPNYGTAPDYVLELERVGADAEPKDPHGTLNLLGLSKDGLRQYEDVSGLSVWSGVSRYGTACLLVAHPGQGLLEGIGDARCFPDGLDPIVDLTGCSPTPEATECSSSGVFGDLPTGSLVRFVLRGDRVDVYVYVRAPDLSASQGEPGAAPLSQSSARAASPADPN